KFPRRLWLVIHALPGFDLYVLRGEPKRPVFVRQLEKSEFWRLLDLANEPPFHLLASRIFGGSAAREERVEPKAKQQAQQDQRRDEARVELGRRSVARARIRLIGCHTFTPWSRWAGTDSVWPCGDGTIVRQERIGRTRVPRRLSADTPWE